VGFAPYDVVLVGDKAYVSNWGGRRPDATSVTGPAGQGTRVRVDPVRHIASEGSVSVIDLAAGVVRTELLVGLHASALALSPDGRQVAVANAGSDTVSVIDARTDLIVETISLKWRAGDLFGASPNALAFDRQGRTLFVCNGTQNAVAVVSFKPGASKLRGLIPTGWFPGAIVYDATRRSLYVANIKGIGSGAKYGPGEKLQHNSHQYFGSLTLVRVPGDRQLAEYTRTVGQNYRRAALEAAQRPPRGNQPARPVPERVGEPSLFKHVVYIIKENRTYDQVLGDLAQGNGDPSLCVFGEQVTPNQHKMVREFVLLDNTYCSGILSADGHQWADSAFATDYMEKSFAGFPRSYPDGMDDDDVDALAYAPSGFIWDLAIAHGKRLRDYGEFGITQAAWKDASRKDKPKFLDYYRDFVNQTGLIQIYSRPAIESLRPYLCTNTVGWDMAIPDIFRAAQFIRELRQFEQTGEFPNLVIICLPNDHTSGTKANWPTPAAQVADNDLAFGQIVEALSRSRFWRETCILAIEDDPQDGWDHVSGYRTTAYVISPYTKRGQVISTQYNQTGLIRTMELILGLPPMNLMDATATPMFDCFTDTADYTPFTAVPNNIPLDQMNPDPKRVHEPLQRRYAYASARLPLDQPDRCPEDLLNRIIWHAMKGPHSPYPSWAITHHKGDHRADE
jgi:YVTN family beta-propeller protein